MEYLKGTTQLFIEGEDIPLPRHLNWAYTESVVKPFLYFFHLLKDECGVYYALSLRLPDNQQMGYVCISIWLQEANELQEIYKFKDPLTDDWKQIKQGDRRLTIRLLRWMCKYIKEEDLPYLGEVNPILEPYFKSFLKMRGLEAIQIYFNNNNKQIGFKVVEKNVMEYLYEGLE